MINGKNIDKLVELDKRAKRKRRVNGAGAPELSAADPDAPVIRIVGGELPRIVDEAEAALLGPSGCNIYQRGGMLVRLAMVEIETADGGKATGHRLVEATATYLVEQLTRAARFERFDRRVNDWIATDCPEKIAATYLARLGEWRVPTLLGVVHAPTLRRDGSILENPGFDRASRLLYDPGDAKFAPIPERPTRDEARAALDVLLELIEPFKSVGPEDRAAVLAAVITPGVRRSMPHAPLFAITAPVAGSLKSKLVDTASYIWSGHPAPVTSQGGKDGGELEKRLSASLLAGDALISIDNCERPLGGELLCQMLSQLVCRVRVFGTLTNADTPSNCCIYATGNNLLLIGDVTRRSLLASLDPRCERPEEREFTGPPPDAQGANHREAYAVAALTILRAYVVAGRPKQQAAALGGFEGWSRMVRDPLLWLGEADACATMRKARDNDPVRAVILPLMEQWAELIGVGEHDTMTAGAVVERANERDAPSFGSDEWRHPDFRAALLAVAAGNSGNLDQNKLGYWLRAHKDRIVGGRRFVSAGQDRNKVALWRLEQRDRS